MRRLPEELIITMAGTKASNVKKAAVSQRKADVKKSGAAARNTHRPTRAATKGVAPTPLAAAAVDATTVERPVTRAGANAHRDDHGVAMAKGIKYDEEPPTDATVSSLEDSVASADDSDFEQPRNGKKKAIIVNNEKHPKSKQEASKKKKAKPAQGKGGRQKVLAGTSPIKTTDNVLFCEEEDRNGSIQVHEETVNPKTDDWRVWAVLDY